MEIAQFVVTHRDNALAVGDHDSYRRSLSKNLHTSRKRLGLLGPRGKFQSKTGSITGEKIKENSEFARIFVMMAERARAHALSYKSAHMATSGNKEISGRDRSHILSRLNKAVLLAQQLSELIKPGPEAEFTAGQVLETVGYEYSLRGEHQFEKASLGDKSSVGPEEVAAGWRACLSYFAVARVAYEALLKDGGLDVHRDIIAQVIDRNIEYAAYRAVGNRTSGAPVLSKKHFPRHLHEVRKVIDQVSPGVFKDSGDEREGLTLCTSATWLGRTVEVADPTLGSLLAQIEGAKTSLSDKLVSLKGKPRQDQAEAYDGLLSLCQEAADRVHHNIGELLREKVPEEDERVQQLRVVDLAVNHELVSWRIGRNRILIGTDDGLRINKEQEEAATAASADRNDIAFQYTTIPESTARQVARLRERTVLFDSIIQSINAFGEIPGATRDQKFYSVLLAQRKYFKALRCLNLGYFHLTQGAILNVLALVKRASDLAGEALEANLDDHDEPFPAIRGIGVTKAQAESLAEFTSGALLRFHALAEMHAEIAHEREAAAAQESAEQARNKPALINRLYDTPDPAGIDPDRLVDLPPFTTADVRPVPVKPIYLDLAWDFVGYPSTVSGSAGSASVPKQQSKVAATSAQEPAPEQPKKKGWFW